MKKTLVMIVLMALFLLLQNRLWWGSGSLLEVRNLKRAAHTQEVFVKQLEERNQLLEAEVQDLKYRLDALEERARTDLGMVKPGETFYQNPS